MKKTVKNMPFRQIAETFAGSGEAYSVFSKGSVTTNG